MRGERVYASAILIHQVGEDSFSTSVSSRIQNWSVVFSTWKVFIGRCYCNDGWTGGFQWRVFSPFILTKITTPAYRMTGGQFTLLILHHLEKTTSLLVPHLAKVNDCLSDMLRSSQVSPRLSLTRERFRKKCHKFFSAVVFADASGQYGPQRRWSWRGGRNWR